MAVFTAIAAAVAGAASLVQTGVSMYDSNQQKKEAEDLRNQERPEVTIPDSAKRALETQEYLASSDAPGMAAAKAQSEERAAQQYEQMLNVAKSPNAAQGALGNQQAALTDEARTREQTNQQWKMQQQQNLGQAQNKMGEIEWSVQQKNEQDPYWHDQARAQSLETASQANRDNALSGLTNTAMGAAYMGSQGAFDSSPKTAAAGVGHGGTPGYGQQQWGQSYQPQPQQFGGYGQQPQMGGGFNAPLQYNTPQSTWKTPKYN